MDEMPWTGEQEALLDRLEELLEASRRDPAPRLVRVEGASRTGKSSLIMEMRRRVADHFDDEASVLVVATTNAAAAAVKGSTTNVGFMLPTRGEPSSLNSWDRERLRKVRVVLIDECNMVSRDLLKSMDRRLRSVAGENGARFGGRIVFAFGDHRSWGPVPFVAGSRPPAHLTWRHFDSVSLEEVHLQDASFRDALRRLADDRVALSDYYMFKSRVLTALAPEEAARFNDAPWVFVGREAAEEYNTKRRESEMKRQLALAPSTRIVTCKSSMDPYNYFDLWEGAKVMVTRTMPGLVTAGDLGHVLSLTLSPDGTSVEAALVEVESEAVRIRADEDGTIPLVPSYTATSLPRALGIHFARVVVQLPDNGWGGLEFVYSAISRARGWSGVAFYGSEVPKPNHKPKKLDYEPFSRLCGGKESF